MAHHQHLLLTTMELEVFHTNLGWLLPIIITRIEGSTVTLFTGINCELDVSMCNASGGGPKKCQNGGRCVEGVGATFSCECQDGE